MAVNRKSIQTVPGKGMHFAQYAATYTGDDCLAWPYGRDGRGYGALSIKRKSYVASRVVCELAHGPAPEGKTQAAHSCGNGHLGCVNPRHLRWASPKENMQDAVAHGNNESRPKLKPHQVEDVFMRHRGGERSVDLANEYGVHPTVVSDIVSRKIWREITSKLQ